MNTNQTLTSLEHLGLLSVSGQDAKKFLQGQLTCNMDEITPSVAHLAAHCNPQGRIISLFRIFIHNDQYYLQMPKDLIPIAYNNLKKYAVFFKVNLTDESKNLMILGGEGTPPDNLPNDFIILKLADMNNYEIIGKPEQIKKIFTHYQNDINGWHAQEIAAGIPTIYAVTSEKFLPHELNLQKLNGISFNKGCYTGQEIIARMQYRGKLKNHMYRARLKTTIPPQYGNEINNSERSTGSIVDYVSIGYNIYELLIIASEADVNAGSMYLHKEPLEFLTLPYDNKG